MNQLKVLHTADTHFSNTPDKLEESIRTTDAILENAKADRPDVIILSGDTVDEFDGRIRLDSDAARAAIRFVKACGDIAPTIIIRGTKSHDRETPYLFRELQAENPIYVSDKIEMVGLRKGGNGIWYFAPIDSDKWDILTHPDAVFTCIPSLDKSALLANCDAMGIKEANTEGKTIFNDMFTAIGQVNASIKNVPRIMIGHGMITGAEFSSGQEAIGEDLEFGVGDIRLGNFDVVCMGHVHKFQKFPGNIFYSGSPGRMNFGEKEEKGFLVHDFDGQELKEVKFVPTPARRFAFYESTWADGGIDTIRANANACERECAGADVRFRYTIPDEEKHLVDRSDLEKRFVAAGARKVKIECQILPQVRQRAAGISNLTTLPEKIVKWGEAAGQEIPQRTLDIAATIEGKEVDELIADALAQIDEVPQTTTVTVADEVKTEEDGKTQTAMNF